MAFSLCHDICIFMCPHTRNKSAVSSVIPWNNEGNMVAGNMSYAFIRPFQWQSRNCSPLSPFWRWEITTAALPGGAFEDRVDILSAKPLAMCDCFYLFNMKKYKIEFYERERGKKSTFCTQTGWVSLCRMFLLPQSNLLIARWVIP